MTANLPTVPESMPAPFGQAKEKTVWLRDIERDCDGDHTAFRIFDQFFAACFFAGLTSRLFSLDSCDADHSEHSDKPAG